MSKVTVACIVAAGVGAAILFYKLKNSAGSVAADAGVAAAAAAVPVK